MTISEESKKMALEYLQKLLTGLEQGVDFAKEQVPVVTWEIIAYGRALHTLTLVISICWVVLIVMIYKKWWKYSNTFLPPNFPSDAPIAAKGFGGVIAGLISLPGFFNFTSAFGPCLKSWVAPRLYLIEYLHTLTK